MCPTRELALQVSGDLALAGNNLGARVLTVYGGVGYEPQLDALKKGVDIVVGTPGRLLDLKNRRDLDLSQVSVLVLDEADEMLDLGFLPDVEKLVRATPTTRQTLLFSATMPTAIMALARANLNQPVNIRAEAAQEQTTVPQTTQFVYQVHDLDKPTILGKLLQNPEATKIMVFCTTKRQVERLSEDLKDRGFKTTSIYGDLSQAVREKNLEKFRSGKAQVIICTDVAARGIDIDLVTHVVNYDCPDSELTYIHRIGRTARAGNTGIAITFVDWRDITRWKVINKALDLPFTDPPESYSTTPELLADLGIDPAATGRILVEGTPVKEHANRTGEKSSHSKDHKSQPREGRRTRRSNGVAVREKGEAEPLDSSTPPPSTPEGEKRRRRRHRRTTDAPDAPTTDAS
jgi:superfamily II DNA/RNA helicase